MVENSQLNIQLKDGNQSVYKELLKLTYSRMLSYCRIFIQDQAQSNDFVQECFVRLLVKQSSIKTTNSVESLLFIMLRNRCQNFLRDPTMQSIAKTISFIGENVGDKRRLPPIGIYRIKSLFQLKNISKP